MVARLLPRKSAAAAKTVAAANESTAATTNWLLRNGRYHFPRIDLCDLLPGLRPQPTMLLLWLLGLLVWLQPQRLVDPGRKNCRKCAPTWCNITGHSKGACCCSLQDTNFPINAVPFHASIPRKPFSCSSENRIVLLLALPCFATVSVTASCLFHHNFAHHPAPIVQHRSILRVGAMRRHKTR